ncbi:MAG: metallophosphoesterase [Solirubrobacterales bacterium]
MRALVISDLHLGAWTGEDLLSDERFQARLEPALEGVDELVILGDLFDLLFGSIEEALAASETLFAMLRERLAGRRLVFCPGNHDLHFRVLAEHERRARSRGPGAVEEGAQPALLRSMLSDRLEGVDVQLRYPTHTVGDVLLTHGHFLDPHARLSGGVGGKLLTRTLWAIAAGGREDPRTVADYDAIVGFLTELLYSISQLPHGTVAQQRVFDRAESLAGIAARLRTPVRALGRLLSDGGTSKPPEVARIGSHHFDQALAQERARLGGDPDALEVSSHDIVRLAGPSDPRERALGAFATATGTPVAGSTSPISPTRFPTPSTCAAPGRAPRR